MKKIFLLICIFVITGQLISQPNFEITIGDYWWGDPKSSYVNILIYFEIKNSGVEAGKCTDIYGLGMECSNQYYKYGKQITFERFLGNVDNVIDVNESIKTFIVFNVPVDADNLYLKFTPKTGGASKFLSESYNKWLKNNRDESKFIQYGSDYFKSEDYVKAIISYYKALNVNPKAKVNFELANAWLMIEDYDNAIKCYKNSFDEVKDKSLVYNNLGYAYFEKGYYNDAISNFAKAFSADSKHWDAVLGASISYYEMNDFESAKYYFNMAAEIEKQLLEGMSGLQKLLDQGYFYTKKQLISINGLCRICGYTYY